MSNIIEEYLKFIEKFLVDYYKVLLASFYDKKLVSALVNKYIDVRYNNNTVFSKEKNIVERINKELNLIAKDFMIEDEDNEEKIKNTFALFGYVLYIDDVVKFEDKDKLVETLFNDKNIKMQFSDATKDSFKDLVRNFYKKRDAFFKLFESKDFSLGYKRIRKDLYEVNIERDCKLSSIYNDAIVTKAFNTGLACENKYYLMYTMLSSVLLRQVTVLNFTRKYIVDFPVTLFNKSRKINKYLKIFDSPIAKAYVNLRYEYKYYLKNKELIDSLISDGYSVSVILDETFNYEFDKLVVFTYVFIYEKYDYYDMIIDRKDMLNTTVVTL